MSDRRPDTEVAEVPVAIVSVEGEVLLIGECSDSIHLGAGNVDAKKLWVRGFADVNLPGRRKALNRASQSHL